MKTCYKCQQTKPLSDFYNCKREKDGKQQKCKECFKEYDKAHKKTDRVLHDINDKEIHEIILNDFKNNINPRETGKNHKISRQLIYKILKLNNINTADLNRKRKHKILNESYFKIIDSEDKAYFLGLLWADGCNYRTDKANQIHIALQEGDKHILSEFANKIYGNDDILNYRIRNNKDGCDRQNVWHLRIPSRQMSDDLLNLGMEPRKSFTVEWPKNLPEQFEKDFIRGYLDGDGSIYKRNTTKQYTVFFIGSPDFIKELKSKMEKQLKFNVCSYELKHYSKPMSNIKIHGNLKCKSVLDWLYTGSTVKLNRKYQRYQDLLLSKLS